MTILREEMTDMTGFSHANAKHVSFQISKKWNLLNATALWVSAVSSTVQARYQPEPVVKEKRSYYLKCTLLIIYLRALFMSVWDAVHLGRDPNKHGWSGIWHEMANVVTFFFSENHYFVCSSNWGFINYPEGLVWLLIALCLGPHCALGWETRTMSVFQSSERFFFFF